MSFATNRFRLAAAVALAFTAPSSVSAAVFDFSFSGSGYNAFGQFTTSDIVTSANGISANEIFEMSGEVNGVAITGLLALDTFGGNDNLLLTESPYLTVGGVSFHVGEEVANLYFNNRSITYVATEDSRGVPVEFAFAPASVAAVPEASTWAMMLVGFGFVGGALRYRRRSTNVVYG